MKYALLVLSFVGACSHGRAQTPPEAAVAQLTEAIATRTELTEDDLYAAMAKAGIPVAAADRAFKFTQIAWGQQFLAGLGDFTFAPDYLCFNAAGDVIESGLLREQPYHVAALAAARWAPPQEACTTASSEREVNAG